MIVIGSHTLTNPIAIASDDQSVYIIVTADQSVLVSDKIDGAALHAAIDLGLVTILPQGDIEDFPEEQLLELESYLAGALGVDSSALATETASRIAADSALASSLAHETTVRGLTDFALARLDSAIHSNLNVEINRAKAAESALAGGLAATNLTISSMLAYAAAHSGLLPY